MNRTPAQTALLRPLTVTGLCACLTLFAGCGIPKEEHDAALRKLREEGQADLDAAQRKAQEEYAKRDKALAESAEMADGLKARGDDLERKLVRAEKSLEDCTSKGGDKAKMLAQCQAEQGQLRDRLGSVEGVIQKVRSALKAMSDAGKLTVKVERGFLIIALQGDILFDSGKSTLKEGAEPVLAELAEVLKSMPDRRFQVAGHTDNQGKESTNWRLSMDRALTVVEFLVLKGVAGKGLSSGGYGPYQPVGGNETPEGRAVNRRVEFLLVPNLDEIFGGK